MGGRGRGEGETEGEFGMRKWRMKQRNESGSVRHVRGLKRRGGEWEYDFSARIASESA